jgi:hypothetical protein
LDVDVINNGVKLVGEAVVPGASLLLEKHISAGLLAAGVGVLGSAALGSLLGPIGYVLGRYGTSAASYALSLEQPPPSDDVKQAIKESTDALAKATAVNAEAIRRTMQEHTQTMQNFATMAVNRMAPPAPASTPEITAAVVAALQQAMPQMVNSVRAAMEEAAVEGQPRRTPART